jgi:hypothetical protein
MPRYGLAVVLVSASCHAAPGVPPPRTVGSYVALAFGDLYQRGARLEPTERLLAARGQRVRIVGFMARMERPPADGFYLTRRPLFCDEGGGGTGDLPPDAIRVEVVGPGSGTVAYIPGPIEIIGVLQLGAKEHPDGGVSYVRILLSRSTKQGEDKS